MSNTEDLKSGGFYVHLTSPLHKRYSLLALRDVLETGGVMGDMRAKMRTEVFHALDDKVTC